MHSVLSAQGSIMICKIQLKDKTAYFIISVEITQNKALTLTIQLLYTERC